MISSSVPFIYFHMPDEGDRLLTQDAYQLNGSDAHKKSDLAAYSTKKSMLQGLIIISLRYCQ